MQYFDDFGERLVIFAQETPAQGTFDTEFSHAKGIIFIDIGLVSGTILTLWAAQPYLKFSPPSL